MSTEGVKYVIGLNDQISSGLKNVSATAKKTESDLKKMGATSKSSGSGTVSMFSGIGGAIAGLGITAGVLAVGKSIVSMGANMEMTRVSFETFLGSAEKGNAVISKLNEFANVTPFDNEQVISAGRSLLAFGVQSEALIPTLTSIGDISSAVGKDFNELTTIYGKAKTAGVLMSNDINQLLEAGIPIIDEFATILKKNPEDIKKMASESKISFATLQKAFVNLTKEGGKFGGLMDKQSKTLSGVWSSLVGSMQLYGSQIGESIAPFLKDAIDSVGGFVNWIKTNLSQLGNVFAPLMSFFNPLINVFNDLSARISQMTEGTSLLESTFTAIGNILAFLEPAFKVVGSAIGSVFTKIFDLGVAIFEFVKKTEWAQNLLKGILAGIVGIFTATVVTIKNMLTGIGDILIGIFTMDAGKIASGMKSLAFASVRGVAEGVQAGKKTFDTKTKDFGFGSGVADGGKPKEKGKTLADFIAPDRVANGDNKKKKSSSSSVDGVSGGRPTNIVINITKLIESFTVSSTNMKMTESEIRSLVSRALIGSVNDVNNIAN
jgi:hypothetical protein